ncbi:MgtC/SapB family protein [Paenibacillus chungangensis]|uniref:MgtC/SapB family protein n=1 Tax=Paenibacillus chungangensis TaxID=696535 RepID=A0ABW3HL74_9BACL
MDIWHIDYLEIAIRMSVALLLGGIIGIERELKNHQAGFRTHILVCMGSTLIMILSIYGFPQFVNEPNVRIDPARLAAQVVSGIGFLGAGTIIRHGLNVKGLTTAASLWVSAGIGLSIGAGFYFAAGITTVMVVFSLLILNKIESLMFRRKVELMLEISDQPGALITIINFLKDQGLSVKNMTLTQSHHREGDIPRLEVKLSVKGHHKLHKGLILEHLKHLSEVKQVQIDGLS